MAEYGNREIGIVQDALKEIYDELINGGASEFRQQILNTLLQGRPDNYYTTHVSVLEEAFEPLEDTFGKLNLSTMMDYAFANLNVLVEMDALDDLIEPAQMWTGYDETSEAVLDIANELNENFDFEIDTNQDIYDVTREMTEQLQGSNIKVQDIPLALDMQIRTLDEMKYFEIGSMYSAWSSTEVMRPFTVQLVEIYNQIENLPEELIDELYVDIADSLSLKEGPSDYLRAYDNPSNSQAKAVKNVIKYYLEQLGRQQTGYVNFSSVDNTFYDGGQMMDFYEATDQVAADVGNAIKPNINLFLQNAVEPTQLLNSVKSFQGITADDFPFQIDKGYMQAYNEIIGTQIINNRAIKDVNATVDYIDRYDLSIEDFAEELDIKIPKTSTNVVSIENNELSNRTFLDDLPIEQYPETFEGEDVLDRLVERPGNQSFDEFVKENNLTQREIDILKNNLDDTIRINDYMDVKPGVTPQQLRDSLVKVGQKTPNVIVTRYIEDAYKTFDKVEFPNSTLKDRALFRLTKRIINTLDTAKEMIYDPKGGGYVMGEGTKLNEYLLNTQGIFPTEQVDPAGNRIDFERQLLDEAGVKMLGDGDYWDNLVGNVVAQTIDELTIEGEVILNTPQLDTPTNVVDLDEVISKSDGVDNLNKSKEIMQKNPGFFRKVFNVLEKLDIGDQVITKAIAKGLPALGLASAAPGAAIAYGAYEISILLTDAAQAYNKMQTTDEGFWENFGELSDKYSIAYKISKPVYDIILDSLNDDLTTEGQDEEILFSFNR